MSEEILKRIEETLNEHGRLLKTLVDRAGAGAPAPGTVFELAMPDADGVVHVAGLRLKLDEPIAMDWEPSTQFRSAYQNRIGAKEISNAPFDGSLPKRSKLGYPIHYFGTLPDGSLDPASGRILFGDDSYESDEALMSYRMAKAASTQRLRDYGHKFPS